MALTRDEMTQAQQRLAQTTGLDHRVRPVDLLMLARDPAATPTRDDLADALGVVQALRAELDEAEHHLLAASRAAGATWPELGRALGMTRQGAERRYLSGAPSLDGRRDPEAGRATHRFLRNRGNRARDER